MKKYDFSEGSTNPYTVSDRHGLIPLCLQCGEDTEIILDGGQYFQYFVQGKGYVQDVFPHLNAEQRDLLITGIHPECSEEFYAIFDEEE